MLLKEDGMEKMETGSESKEAAACCGTECCAVAPEVSAQQRDREIKEMVKDQYAAIARSEGSCCGPACCGEAGGGAEASFSEGYGGLRGYVPEADLGLGCGLPTELARLHPGQRVLDLGSGAGNDVFIARAEVGETGHVLGVDFTPGMIAKARANNSRLGFNNVEFRLGEIENLPVESRTMDVVISNCVLNLVPDKAKAYAEIHRVLKPGGRISISDVVLTAPVPEKMLREAVLYAGCIAGAQVREEYLRIVEQSGFTGISVARERVLNLPDSLLSPHLDAAEIRDLRERGVQALSITVNAEKPA
jgi:arsenite methyltransferase